jgi:hypothetical protein
MLATDKMGGIMQSRESLGTRGQSLRRSTCYLWLGSYLCRANSHSDFNGIWIKILTYIWKYEMGLRTVSQGPVFYLQHLKKKKKSDYLVNWLTTPISFPLYPQIPVIKFGTVQKFPLLSTKTGATFGMSL